MAEVRAGECSTWVGSRGLQMMNYARVFCENRHRTPQERKCESRNPHGLSSGVPTFS